MAKALIIALIVAYVGWWIWQGPKKKSQPPRGTPDEIAAFATLGLKPGARDADIRAAHRRLVQSVHPDKGGSADLTRRVNAARDTLLKRRD